MFRIGLLFILLFSSVSWSMQIYRVGQNHDVKAQSLSAYCLAGGGDDDAWASGWKYWLNSASHGDVVIIRADAGRGGYDNWIYLDEGHHHFPKLNSVTTLVFDNAQDAFNPDAIKAIENAEAIFFSGGDQTQYVDWFFNTPVSRVMQIAVLHRHVSIAGTSAGMAFMSGIVYAAHYPSPRDADSFVSSSDVLNDPTADFVDLVRNAIRLPFLGKVITDTHFSQRDRLGRLFGFMAKAVYSKFVDKAEHIRGIGVDVDTAFCYSRSGHGRVYGSGQAYFLNGVADIEVIEPNRALTWMGRDGHAVLAQKVSGSAHENYFNVPAWLGSPTEQEYWSVNNGILFTKKKNVDFFDSRIYFSKQ